ncbi:tyrosine-type recombinase/integrase [Nocardiopsis sp. NPDC006938]|uniref:tyrosine-type recombinase/integrase n=1 Tax=Nocardiopsis sp. NPDC006938 TaxID=3364337 RepID=UPI0036A7F621
MGEVLALPGTGSERTLRSAAEQFLEGVGNPNTKRAYRTALDALQAEFGADASLDVLEGEAGADRVADWFASRWGSASANTVNARMRGLSSACAWWSKQGWLTGDPLRRLTSRPVPPDRTRALTRAVVQELLGRDGVALRERVLWRLLYESAARASEVLELDVEDLDLANRRTRVRRKGGAIDTITWQTPTARLLPRLLDGRRTGPVFLTDRRAKGQATGQVPVQDLAPDGRGRLSYRRAEEQFVAASGGSTLHQLRHSALTHAAEDGAQVPILMAYSGHTSVSSVAKYARISAERLGAWQDGRDPAARRGAR